MFNALAVRGKNFQLIFIVAIEMIVESFAANRACHDLVSILTFEHDNVPH